MNRSETEIMSYIEKVPTERLGRCLKDYLVGQIDDLDWEGYSQEDKAGVLFLLNDFITAMENGL